MDLIPVALAFFLSHVPHVRAAVGDACFALQLLRGRASFLGCSSCYAPRACVVGGSVVVVCEAGESQVYI